MAGGCWAVPRALIVSFLSGPAVTMLPVGAGCATRQCRGMGGLAAPHMRGDAPHGVLCLLQGVCLLAGGSAGAGAPDSVPCPVTSVCQSPPAKWGCQLRAVGRLAGGLQEHPPQSARCGTALLPGVAGSRGDAKAQLLARPVLAGGGDSLSGHRARAEPTQVVMVPPRVPPVQSVQSSALPGSGGCLQSPALLL